MCFEKPNGEMEELFMDELTTPIINPNTVYSMSHKKPDKKLIYVSSRVIPHIQLCGKMAKFRHKGK